MRNTVLSTPSSVLYAPVIGDVVSSRRHPDRAALQRVLLASLDKVNLELAAVQGFQITIGDEFQGIYSSIDQALQAVLWLRLKLLLEDVDVRFGVGWGEVPVRDEARAPFAQDGPGWWRAREALERVSGSEKKRRWPREWRTAVVSDDPDRDEFVNAFLLCRDGVLARMDDLDLILTLGALRGERQEDLANRSGITQSAVAQRQQNHGIYTILRAYEQIERLLR